MEQPLERRARFPAEITAPATARRFVRAALRDAGLDALAADAVLLTSELSENAVIHAGTGFDIDLIAADGELTVTITDHGSTPMEVRRAVPPQPGSRRDTHGRGLTLVDAMATAWGTRHDHTGHRIWFTLRESGAPAVPEPNQDQDQDVEPPPAVTEWPDPETTRWLLHVPANAPLPVLVTELLRRLGDVLPAISASVWVDRGDGEEELASIGLPGAHTVTVPLPLSAPRTGRLLVRPTVPIPTTTELAELTAQRIALAVESEAQQAADRERWLWMTYLADAAELFGKSLDVNLTAAIIPQVIVPRLGRWCAVHLLDEHGRPRRAATTHVDEDALPQLTTDLTALNTPQGALHDLLTGGVDLVNLGQPLDGIALPLRHGRETVGTLSIGRTPGRAHRPEEMMILSELARRAAQAIGNAQQNAAHVLTSQALQHALLPRALPAASGVRFAAAYLPASTGIDVGGDFYDVQQLHDGRWLVMVGDVCGKGPRAAARTGVVRDVLRVLVRDGRPLRRAFDLLNEMMMEANDPTQYATVALALIGTHTATPESLDVELVLAGHEQPALVGADATVRFIGEYGSAVGLVQRFAVHPTRHLLHPGEALVFCTDGVTEHRRGTVQFGTDRLASAIAQSTDRSAAGLIATVRRSIKDFSAEPQRDDIAIVTVDVPAERTTPPSEKASPNELETTVLPAPSPTPSVNE